MAPSDVPKRLSQLSAIGFVWDILMAIAMPTVFFALAGRALDRRWHSSPWMTVLGLILAIALSSALVYRKAIRLQKQQMTESK